MVTYGQLSSLVPWLTGTWTLARRMNTDYEEIASDAFYTRITNYVAVIGYSILVWDHIVTFDDEVKYIWKRGFVPMRRNPSTYLFLINRYFTPIAFIGNFVAYFSQWSSETCRRFVRYEGSCVIVALTFADLCLLQRVRALYSNSRYRRLVPGLCWGVILLQLGVFSWLLTHGIHVTHQDANVRACTMIFNPNLGPFWPSTSAWIPLIYDTMVISFTLYKCVPQARINSASHLFRTLVKDGVIYYSVLFGVNLVLAIMIIVAPPAIKNITAQLEQLLTVAMISRITLSLRKEGRRQSHLETTQFPKQHHPPSTHDSWYAPPRPVRALKPAGAGSDFITTSALMRDTGLSVSHGYALSPHDSMRECMTSESLEFSRRARGDYTYGCPDVKRGRRVPCRSSIEKDDDDIDIEYGSIGTTSISIDSMNSTPQHIEYARVHDTDGLSPNPGLGQELIVPDSPARVPPSASLRDRERKRESEPPGYTVSAGSPRWDEATSYELRTMRPAAFPSSRV